MKTRNLLVSVLALLNFSSASAEIQNTFLVSKGKALIVLSSQALLGKDGPKTGIWLPDATHPYFALLYSGYEVDFTSPEGGAVPIEMKSDPRHLNALNPDDAVTRGFMTEDSSLSKITKTLKLSDVQAKDYKSMIIAGGMGAMYDLPENEELWRLVKEFWNQNKAIGAINYGIYGLIKIRTPSGKQFLRGYKLTAISRDEEKKFAQLMGWDISALTPSGFLQDLLKKQRAGFKSGPPFNSFVYFGAQKHLITAQQSFSGLELGLQMAKSMDKPLKPIVPKSEKFMLRKSVKN